MDFCECWDKRQKRRVRISRCGHSNATPPNHTGTLFRVNPILEAWITRCVQQLPSHAPVSFISVASQSSQHGVFTLPTNHESGLEGLGRLSIVFFGNQVTRENNRHREKTKQELS